MENNIINDVLKKTEDVAFLSFDEAQSIAKESFDNWKSEYILRLKHLIKTNIAKCAENGEFNYVYSSEIMPSQKVEALLVAIEDEIIPNLLGYSIDFAILTQTDNFNNARMQMCISWE